MTEYKKPDDFQDPICWESYLLVLFAKRLNPSIREGDAYEICLEYLHNLYTRDDDPEAKDIVTLADELIEGRSPSGSSH